MSKAPKTSTAPMGVKSLCSDHNQESPSAADLLSLCCDNHLR